MIGFFEGNNCGKEKGETRGDSVKSCPFLLQLYKKEKYPVGELPGISRGV